MTIVVSTACAKDAPTTSPIDDMSDEVYEQIVQQYFLAKTQLDILTGKLGDHVRFERSLITDHELYVAVEKYAKENDLSPTSVFPNPLFFEYHEDPDQFTETEQMYIAKAKEFLDASNRANLSDFERLKDELTEELDIKEAYNIFDIEELKASYE